MLGAHASTRGALPKTRCGEGQFHPVMAPLLMIPFKASGRISRNHQALRLFTPYAMDLAKTLIIKHRVYFTADKTRAP